MNAIELVKNYKEAKQAVYNLSDADWDNDEKISPILDREIEATDKIINFICVVCNVPAKTARIMLTERSEEVLNIIENL